MPAWRRLRSDRVGMVCLGVVLAFLCWCCCRRWAWWPAAGSARWACRTRRRTSSAPARRRRPRAIAAPQGPNADLSDVDPLAPRYKEWDERAAKVRTVEIRQAASTLPLGADRMGRDVLAKAIKGTEISIFVGVMAALVATLIGTLLGALAGFFGGRVGDLLEWLYNVFTSIPYILLIFAFAAVFGPRHRHGGADPGR